MVKPEHPVITPKHTTLNLYLKMKAKHTLNSIALLTLLLLTSCGVDSNNDPDADTTKPTVISSNPANNEIDVVHNKVISITFSEEMDPATINSTTISLMQGTTAFTGTVSYSEVTATFTPAEHMQASTAYGIGISSDARDITGNELESFDGSSFTTSANPPDNTSPTVVSSDPQDGEIDVERNKVISITFSEEMDPSTINLTTVTLMEGTTAISGTVEYAEMTATFTPENHLGVLKSYTLNVSIDALDISGNNLENFSGSAFTTGGNEESLEAVNTSTAGDYVILAKTAITNVPTSVITGDLGISPEAASSISGFDLIHFTGYAESAQVTGKVYAADMDANGTPMKLTTAVENMITAYNDAAGRPTPAFIELGSGNIGGKTLSSALYNWSSTVTIPTDVVLDGGADDVWIFQIAGDLTMNADVEITLTGGAQAKNVFWQVAGEVVIGADSHFEGIVLCMTGITLETGASLNGKALAQTAVILDQNTVTFPD